MDVTKQSAAIEQLREREGRRLAAIAQIEQIAAEFPDLLEEFFRACGMKVGSEPRATNGEVPKTHVGRRARSGTAYQRLVKVFLENDNAWTDTSQLTIRSNVIRNVVAHILWSAHRD